MELRLFRRSLVSLLAKIKVWNPSPACIDLTAPLRSLKVIDAHCTRPTYEIYVVYLIID